MIWLESEPLFHHWTFFIWFLSLTQGLTGLLATVFITKALQWISPTQVMVIRTFQVVLSYIIQVQAFNTAAHWSDYLAACLIMAAVFGIGIEEKMLKSVNWKYI